MLVLLFLYTGIVLLTGQDNNILVSNIVDSNKLYLRIQPRRRQVVVAPRYNVSNFSMATVTLIHIMLHVYS